MPIARYFLNISISSSSEEGERMFKSHPFFDNSEDIPAINSFTKGLLDSDLSKGSKYAIVSDLPKAKRRAKILGW